MRTENSQKPCDLDVWLTLKFNSILSNVTSKTVDCAEITECGGNGRVQHAHEFFLAQNVDFNRLSFDLLGSRSPPYGERKFG